VNSPIRTSAIGLLQHLQLLDLPSELDITKYTKRVFLPFDCNQTQDPVLPTKPIVSYQVDIYTDQTLCYWFETEYCPAINTTSIYYKRFIYNINKKKPEFVYLQEKKL
jgi:hypothetical protein